MIGLPFGLLTAEGNQFAQCLNLIASDSGSIQSIAGFRVTKAGQLERQLGGAWLLVIDYVSDGLPDPDVGDRYEVRVIQNSGNTLTNNSGLNVWLTISTTRLWQFDDTPGAFKNFDGTIQIREIADPSNISGVCTAMIDTEDGS